MAIKINVGNDTQVIPNAKDVQKKIKSSFSPIYEHTVLLKVTDNTGSYSGVILRVVVKFIDKVAPQTYAGSSGQIVSQIASLCSTFYSGAHESSNYRYWMPCSGWVNKYSMTATDNYWGPVFGLYLSSSTGLVLFGYGGAQGQQGFIGGDSGGHGKDLTWTGLVACSYSNLLAEWLGSVQVGTSLTI